MMKKLFLTLIERAPTHLLDELRICIADELAKRGVYAIPPRRPTAAAVAEHAIKERSKK
jgi:hypothetical protein